ncbi:MAG: AAA family ATPase [Campylobacteraceae bacterium]|jgi:wobble nucleotide-excising tRNase|nr:AAA family ATPase [Campylobacteraceae bacterium]
MITKINNFTYKSFKNYTNEGDLEFKEKNIIFAYNGKGKSSLSVGIKQEFLKDRTKTENNLRFYNKEDYIKNSLLLESENAKLKGVKASFGAKDVDTENKIKELKSQIVDTEPINKKIENIKSNIKKEISTIHNNKKGTAKIQQKDQSKTIDEIMRLYDNDLKEAKKIEPAEEKLKEIKGDNKLAEKKEQIETLDIGNISNIAETEIENIKNIFSETFQDIEIPSSEIISWLNKGLEIHQEGDNCKFCGGKLDYGELSGKVKEYNENKKQKAILKLKNFVYQMENLEGQISNILMRKENVLSILNQNDKLKDLYEIISNKKNEIENAKKSISSKLENINQSVSFNNQELEDALKNIVDSFSQIKRIKDTQKQIIETQVNKRDILVKGSIACEVLGKQNIKDWVSEIKAEQKTLSDTEKNIKEKKDEIEQLKNAKSEYQDFAGYLNIILTDLSIDLKLEVIDRDYILKHSKDDVPLTIDDISEGEKNLLALLFFYYELFEDDQQQNLKNMDLIIIDDPISSVDHTNKMYILEMMKHLLDVNNVQIFIMTHDWEDFCNLCYSKKDDGHSLFRFFEIKKNSNSFLKLIKKIKSPYKHHFREIFELSEKSTTNDLSDCEIYHYPNIMRNVLEEFLRFKVVNSTPTRKNKKNIGKALFNKEWNQISFEKKLQLNTLLSVCNILSHKPSRNPDEILKSAKFLMNRIKNADINHFNAHKA